MNIDPALIKRFPALFLPHDIYERHYWTIKLLGKKKPGETVLDVGGEGYLKLFARRLIIKDINIEGAEAYDGMAIPYPDKSFDYAVSIDTIEHMPKGQRKLHISELIRVAKKRVVFCAPVNSPMQIELQKALLTSNALDERAVRFVKEHLEYGLPTPTEIQAALPDAPIKWHYAGNLKFYSPPKHVPESKPLQMALSLFLLVMNWLSNRIWLYVKLGEKLKLTTNRFYGVIDL